MSSIPKTPCPVGGLVPWRQGVRRIEARRAHSVLGWLYSIQEQQFGGALVIWCNVTQGELVTEMDAFARWKVGERVHVSRKHPAKIIARKWNFQSGTFDYHVEGIPDQPGLVMDQERLAARITAVAAALVISNKVGADP